MPEVIAHQAAQALLHKHRDMVLVAILNDMLHPLALRCDLPFAVSRFRSDDVPLCAGAADVSADVVKQRFKTHKAILLRRKAYPLPILPYMTVKGRRFTCLILTVSLR